jgi:hypothetical protein
MQDWRGEHLIRGPGPKPALPQRLRAVRRHGGHGRCAVPGCGAALSVLNRTGVCRDHNHHPDLCQCGGCIERRRRMGR